MSSRLAGIHTASRPKMFGRAMISGPSGAGKTWTSLSVARTLADGDLSRVLVIDTESESALTYADDFVGFAHLPWSAPYDPSELADTLEAIQDQYAVVVIDSFSHFWTGLGGTLDQADGKFGGWREARPTQARVVDAVLGLQAHTILATRAKMEYVVSADGKKVERLGMAPVQDATLMYEMNVALEIDIEHRIHVVKSRSPAVPVGRMYPAGHEKKCADDYAGWLAGGEPPADAANVQAILDAFANVPEGSRTPVKREFVKLFGMPETLRESQIVQAAEWVEAQVDAATQPGPIARTYVEGAEPPPDESPAEAAAAAAQIKTKAKKAAAK